MSLDAIIISETGAETYSGSGPLRLEIEGETALLQTVLNYIENQGKIVSPIKGAGESNWLSAPRLSGIYLFNYLLKNNFNIELINKYYEERDLFKSLLNRNPRFIIISTTYILSKQALRKLADDIRTHAPDIFIIAGGPFVYSSYLLLQKQSTDPSYETEPARKDFLFLEIDKEPSVDLYIVSQRGETLLCEILNRIKKSESVYDLPNIAYLKGNEYSFGRRIDDFNDVKGFALDWRSVPDSVFKTGVVPIQASTGCFYKCAFCNFIKDKRLIHVKPLDEFISEIKAAQLRGARYIRFVDDNFRLGKNDLNYVCQRFIDEGINVRWMSFIRASTLKNVDIGLLKQAGGIEMQLGLESADHKILKNMNKQADPALYSKVIKELLSAGINCSCTFILGFPGETKDSICRTVQFIDECGSFGYEGIFSWTIFPFLLAPLSPVYNLDMRSKYGLSGYIHNWKHETMDSYQAKRHIKEVFIEIDNCGTVYSGDNLDMLLNLNAKQRKRFSICRHRLSKLAMQGHLEKDYVLRSFKKALF